MVEIKLNNFRTCWYKDRGLSRIRSGTPYGYTSVTAILREWDNRIKFTETANPYETIKAMRRSDRNIVAVESFWVPGQSCGDMIDIIKDMFLRAGHDGDWNSADLKYVKPTISFAAKRSHLAGLFHPDFCKHVLSIETDILIKKMIKNGIDPEVANQYRVI